MLYDISQNRHTYCNLLSYSAESYSTSIYCQCHMPFVPVRHESSEKCFCSEDGSTLNRGKLGDSF